ncbi:MAG: ISKra4 family transposase, partial [Desulfobacteraceae bacterium]|nr:ISKra4 family transposase [Desulfobacteraceae bacterium]
MTVINLPCVAGQAEQPSDVEKCINDCKTKFNEILLEVLDGKNQEAHRMEVTIFKNLLETGLLLLKLFFANHNQGDYGKTIETAMGTAVRGKKSEKTYFSVFGKLKVIRYLYYVGDDSLVPLDIILNLPVRCYSYFLSEMTDLLNIRDAYSEGSGFLKKFFGIQLSVSASETISDESSDCYEKYYDLKNTLPGATEAGEYTVVSFDGKGVPMIKKEAAKIKGRQGKGKKKQKKKEALVGARYDINATPRTAEESAANLVYPGQKEKEQNKKEEKAQNIRYIASIEKPKKKVMEEIREQVKNDDFRDKPLVCVMDGSLYLWDLLKIVFGDIGNKVLILDIIHVSEYIRLIAHTKCKEGSEDAKQYVYEKLLLILQGKISSYIMELQREMLNGKWNESQLKRFRKVITYFKNHRDYMKYDEYLAKGYPIGSGVVESACSHVVRDRMEISG